jgi:hypothetical protein
MANEDLLAAQPATQEDIAELDELLREMKLRAQQKHSVGNTFMMNVYTKLIADVSPIITDVHARMDKKMLASLRKAERALRQQRAATRKANEQ